MEMRKFVSNPVEIEAAQFDGSNNLELAAWCGGELEYQGQGFWRMKIPTLEGVMEAFAGTWIIKGTEGEFYPCKPSVFERKYSEVKPKIEIHINEPAYQSPRLPRDLEYDCYYD